MCHSIRKPLSAKVNPKRAIIVRAIMKLLPEPTCFGLKRILWRWAGATIKSNVRICSSAFILGSGNLEIGEDTWIGHQVFIETGSNITIGSYVDIAPRVYIGTGSHVIDATGKHIAGEGTSQPIIIQDGAWIGANATILPGVTIGAKAIVGASAVVTRNVPQATLVIGIPAKPFRTIVD